MRYRTGKILRKKSKTQDSEKIFKKVSEEMSWTGFEQVPHASTLLRCRCSTKNTRLKMYLKQY